jgi:hypothetical protein
VPGDRDQAALGGVVARPSPAGADLAEDRGNVDHGWIGPAEQRRGGQPAQVDRDQQVDLDDAGDVRVRLAKGLRRTAITTKPYRAAGRTGL